MVVSNHWSTSTLNLNFNGPLVILSTTPTSTNRRWLLASMQRSCGGYSHKAQIHLALVDPETISSHRSISSIEHGLDGTRAKMEKQYGLTNLKMPSSKVCKWTAFTRQCLTRSQLLRRILPWAEGNGPSEGSPMAGMSSLLSSYTS